GRRAHRGRGSRLARRIDRALDERPFLDAEALRHERAAGTRGLGHGEGLRADLAVELALELDGHRLHLGPDPPPAGHPQAALQLDLAVEAAVHRQILSVQRPRKDLLGPEDGPSFFSNARHNALLLLGTAHPGAPPQRPKHILLSGGKKMIRPRALASSL